MREREFGREIYEKKRKTKNFQHKFKFGMQRRIVITSMLFVWTSNNNNNSNNKNISYTKAFHDLFPNRDGIYTKTAAHYKVFV